MLGHTSSSLCTEIYVVRMMSFVWVNWKKQVPVPLQKGNRNSISQRLNLAVDKVRRPSQDSRSTSISTNVECRLPNVYQTETENEQLHKVRDVQDRIAKHKARRKSFTKVNARKSIKIHLHGTREKVLSEDQCEDGDCTSGDEAVFWEPEAAKEEVNVKVTNVLESFSIDRTDDAEKIFEPKLFIKKKKQSVSWAVEDKNASRRQSVRKGLLGAEFGRKASVDVLGRKRSETFPRSHCDNPIDEVENEITTRKKDSKAYWSKEDCTGRDKLPRLSYSHIKTLCNLDRVLQAEGSNRSLFYRRGTKAYDVLEKRRSTVKIPALPDRNPSLNKRLSITVPKAEFPVLRNSNNNTTNRRVSRGNQELVEKDFNQERRGTLWDAKIPHTFRSNQSRAVDEGGNKGIVSPFPSMPRLKNKRLSEAFREIKECRYLRLYSKV